MFARCGVASLALVLTLGMASAAHATIFTADPSAASTGNGPSALAIGDLDGDGIPDLAAANESDGTASLLTNDGSGNFSPLACLASACNDGTLSADNDPDGIAIGDLNGDGRNDVVVANGGLNATNGTVDLYTANADGSYTENTISNSVAGPFPVAVAIADLNGDGKPDILIANGGPNPQLTLLLRSTATGAGTSAAQSDYTASTPLTLSAGALNPSIAVGDLNGDGKADIAVTDSLANTVTVLYQTPTGFNAVPVTTNTSGAGPTAVAIGDLNGDGRPDLVVASENAATITPFLKDPTGTGFTASTPLAADADNPGATDDPGAVAIGDFDGDGRNDIAVANIGDFAVSVFLKDPTGTTYTPTTLSADSGEPGSLVVGDLAGTGKIDIASANDLFDNFATVLANTTPQATSTSVVAAPASPSSSGTPVTFTATVAKVVTGLRGSLAPTGTVTFTVDGAAQTPVDLAPDGTAALPPSSLTVGPHTIDSAYSGDANYAASTQSTSYTVTSGAAPSPPVVVTGSPTSVSGTGATLTGSVNPSGVSTTYTFEYGTSFAPGATTQITTGGTVGSGSAAVPETATLTGLTPGTTYFYRLVGSSAAGDANGGLVEFRTTGGAAAPVVVTGAPSAVTGTTASLAGMINPNGIAATYTFEYGTSFAPGATTQITVPASAGDGSGAAAETADLTDLTPGTTYFVRLVGSSAAGDTNGDLVEFKTTGGPAAPIVVTGGVTGVTSNSAVISGTVNPNGVVATYTFEYGTSFESGATTQITTPASAGSGTDAQAETTTLTGLSPGTTYFFRLVGSSTAGDTNGGLVKFTTTPAT